MDKSLEKLKARAEVYRLLSRAYSAPEEGFLKSDFLDAAKRAFETLVPPVFAKEWQRLVSYLETQYEPIELAVEYTRLFRGPVKAQAYPYESMHVDGEAMGKSSLDAARRYGEAGVSVAEDFKDLPDHISAELEFMHYLCGRELDALQRGADDDAACFRHTGQAFLKDHLSRWVPQLTGLVMQHATTPYYLTIAEITREFIRRETASGLPGQASDGNDKPVNHDRLGYQV